MGRHGSIVLSNGNIGTELYSKVDAYQEIQVLQASGKIDGAEAKHLRESISDSLLPYDEHPFHKALRHMATGEVSGESGFRETEVPPGSSPPTRH